MSSEKIGKFTIKQVGPESDRVLRFIGTDASEDRDGDIVTADGWDFSSYLKNPVFIAFHDYSRLPPGKCIAINQSPGTTGTMFDIKFASISELCPDNQSTPSQDALFAETIYQSYRNGYMNAVSVGFMPKRSEERTDQPEKPQWNRGKIFLEKELLELSGVPVPSNQNALIQARSAKTMKPDQIKMLETIFGVNEGKKLDLTETQATMKALLGGQIDIPEDKKEGMYLNLKKKLEEFGEKAPDLKAYTASEIKSMFEEETDMDEKSVQKAIGDAVAPLLDQIKALQETKGGAKYSAETKAKMQEAHDHLEKGIKCLKDMISDSGTVGNEGNGVEKPKPNTEPDADDKGIDLSKIDLKKYGIDAQA